jgi:hypothetical protein
MLGRIVYVDASGPTLRLSPWLAPLQCTASDAPCIYTESNAIATIATIAIIVISPPPRERFGHQVIRLRRNLFHVLVALGDGAAGLCDV